MRSRTTGEGEAPSPLSLFGDPGEDLSQLPHARRGVAESPSSAVDPEVETHRWAAVISYRGTSYRGFAIQSEGVRTVSGELTSVLSTIFRHRVTLTVSGRTDAGVHAVANVVTFDAPKHPGGDRLRNSLSKLLPRDISVSWIGRVDEGFDARFSARWRQYVYLIRSSPVRSALAEGGLWQPEATLDLNAMRNGAWALIGHHDFAAFSKSARGVERSTVRDVFEIVLSESNGIITLAIWANSFCQQMVRSIVGVLTEVGKGRLSPAEVRGILLSGDRRRVKVIAPPDGLYLYRVGFQPYTPAVVQEFHERGFLAFDGGLSVDGLPL